MPHHDGALTLSVIDGIEQVPAADWDACAGTAHPFTRHAFLHALEASGSATGRRGWLPQHVLVHDGDGRLVGAAPLYLKSHSFGEYVFDWSWADAYERAGGQYYPKLQAAVPFTPVTGARLLVRPDLPEADHERVADGLADGLIRVARRHDVSSLHVTFPTRADWKRLGAHGCLQRVGLQYHFTNPGYAGFDDFLAALRAHKRKQIRRERREVAESGLTIRRLTGRDIEPRHWEAFYDFYLATADKRFGFPYLTPDFFERLGAAMAEDVVLVMAWRPDGTPVAGALNLAGEDALYGRIWGCSEEHRFLHFECCYYQAIEHAIASGLSRVEAGAQGEHKLQRGYLPVETYSAHWIADPRLRAGVADFIERERPVVRAERASLMGESPFRFG